MSKQKQGKSLSGLLFTTKIILQFNPKLQNYKRILTKLYVKGGLKQFNFFQLAFKC